MIRPILFGAALVLAGGGCAHFTAKPLDPAANASRINSLRLAEKTWTLQALEEEAVRFHPEVAVARAQYETARAAIGTAGERPNPTLSLTPQIVTPYTALIAGTYGVDLDWTFETAGKRSRRLEVAQAGVRAAAAHVVEAIWKTRSQVRKAFLDLHAARQRARLLGEVIARQEELLKTIEERIQAGAESRLANVQPRLSQAQLRLQASDAAKNAVLARATLAEALGMSAGGLESVRFSFETFQTVPATPGDHRLSAVTHRADVLAALADYAVAEGTLRSEIAKQYPDLHLIPGYQLDAGQNKWGLGIGVTLPILHQNQGPIGEAEAKRKEAEAKFNALQARVLAECDRAAAAVAAAREKVAVTEELLALQTQRLESEQRLRAAGEGDKLTLLTAQVESATTQILRLEALVELQSALGALEDATQTPLEP